MSQIINKITIKGYKSIKCLDALELRNINVFIGANGAGKSNFVSFLQLLRDLIEKRLNLAVAKQGGADACLYLGPRETPQLDAGLTFGPWTYEFSLESTPESRFVFSRELIKAKGSISLGSGYDESSIKDLKDDPALPKTFEPCQAVFEAISRLGIYHFHDTSSLAAVRRPGPLNDNSFLRPSAENLAAFLLAMQQEHSENYKRIGDVVRLAAPFFDDFRLRSIPGNRELIQLEWLQQGSDLPFLAGQLSDGTLRFICLVTALLQPDRPTTIVFDEPELGLHPYAIALFAGLAKSVANSRESQIIICTQSELLLNEFAPEDVVVVERRDRESVFHHLNSEELSEWLSEYSLGELWLKNVLGGRARSDIPGLQPA